MAQMINDLHTKEGKKVVKNLRKPQTTTALILSERFCTITVFHLLMVEASNF